MTTTTPDLLEAIVAATACEVDWRRRQVDVGELASRASMRSPRGDAFHTALATAGRVNVIAECKRRSPSRGVLRQDYQPAEIARAYERAGAVAVSVLTEAAFFDGALDHLEQVRSAVEIPVLRKDFIVSEYQILEAKAAGADAILLIVAALDDATLRDLHDAARKEGLAVLVEVHDADELCRAIDAGAEIIGVNNRNLRTLEVNVDASRAVVEKIPDTAVGVAESGLRSGRDIAGLRRAGYDAFLIGEALMTHDEPGLALAALRAEIGSVG